MAARMLRKGHGTCRVGFCRIPGSCGELFDVRDGPGRPFCHPLTLPSPRRGRGENWLPLPGGAHWGGFSLDVCCKATATMKLARHSRSRTTRGSHPDLVAAEDAHAPP